MCRRFWNTRQPQLSKRPRRRHYRHRDELDRTEQVGRAERKSLVAGDRVVPAEHDRANLDRTAMRRHLARGDCCRTTAAGTARNSLQIPWISD